jgi:hypothetical protein
MTSEKRKHQYSTAAPYLTFCIVLTLFILIHFLTSFISFPITYTYVLLGPLMIVYMKQIGTPFIVYPFFGFIAMMLI